MARAKKPPARTIPSPPDRIGVAKTYKLFVNGAFVRSESGRVLGFHDERGRYVTSVPHASRKDFRDAVGAARAAFGPWAGRTAFNRSQILFRMAEMLEHRAGEFAGTLAKQAGCTPKTAADEVEAAVDRIFWYAGWADKFAQVLGGVNPVAAPFFNFTHPEPTGVVALFAPTRSPLLGLVSALIPILVPGNCVVAIIESPTPTVALDLAEVLATSDLPAGVVNLLTGRREELLPHVAGHLDVNAVAFHGNDPDAVRRLQTEAASNLKRIHVGDDPSPDTWRDADRQSLYCIQPFVEWKTTWHPIGL